jgi:putative aldouronate transport system permease protein
MADSAAPLMRRRSGLLHRVLVSWELYAMLALPLLWYLVFQYIPIYGVQIAFKDFIASRGITGSPWVGFRHFQRFFASYYFGRLIRNTVGISLGTMALGFPTPIVLALLINEIRGRRYQKLVQNITYIPYFLSVVVIVGILTMLLHPSTGVVNRMLLALGAKEAVRFMEKPEYFKTIYVVSNVWQNMGWNSIIYLAALSGVDPQLHDAAAIDGASRLQRIRYIAFPALLPTISILFILRVGTIMSVGFEKVFLMQNALNMSGSDVISTFVYRTGILGADYSFASAVGLFNSVINFVLLFGVNALSRRLQHSSLW